MPPDGIEKQAHWRIVGKWWEGESPTETIRYITKTGIRKENTKSLPPLTTPALSNKSSTTAHYENHNEDYSIRPRKSRDETVDKALGYLKKTSLIHNRHSPSKSYIPLHCLSGFSFGRSLLLPAEIARLAAYANLPAVCIVDRFSLAGAVELAQECKKQGIKPLIGTTLELEDGSEIVLIAKTHNGYKSLSNLITKCHLNQPRLFPLCSWNLLQSHAQDLICLTGGNLGPINRSLIKGKFSEAQTTLTNLINIYQSQNVFIEIERTFLPWELQVEKKLIQLACHLNVKCVASCPTTHRRPNQFPAQDILVCADTLATVDEVIGRKPRRHEDQPPAHHYPARAMNAERYFKSAQEFIDLFSDQPDLIENTHLIANLCDPNVLPGPTELPLISPNPEATLREVVYQGMKEWHRHQTPQLKKRIDYEIERINRLGYANHFLVAWDMCNWAHQENIQFSGRGSVVDAAVSYCLGFSRIDAFTHGLHFDRFLPNDGTKKPDIDIDFEANRRDDVRNYLIHKYGKDHVATIAAIGTYRVRGIIREVGKALDIPEAIISYVAKKVHGGVNPENLLTSINKRPELRESNIDQERLKWVFRLAEDLRDVPRNIRAHSSGVVISKTPIADTVPVMWSGSGSNQEDFLRITQWDKRSAKRCFIKFDILCLRGQDVLSGTEHRLKKHDPTFRVDKISTDNPEIYRAMRSSQTVGIPQSASPAMTQAHARIKTQNLTDASLVQAGIRPGVGGAVKLNTLIARRHGDPYKINHPDLEAILGHTYGIVVFQEQIDLLLEKFCGLSGGEAEDIREKIHEKRHQEYGDKVRQILLHKTIDQGYTPQIANEVLDLIVGFKGYGFAQGHALAFAEISARSIYCQQNYPAEYFAALLDAQPAGYYGPSTLVNEARIRGLKVLPVDVNLSDTKIVVEDVRAANPTIIIPRGGIRLDLNQVHGLSQSTIKSLINSRPFQTFFQFVQRVKPHRDELEQLILCGAFDSIHPNRRALLWSITSAFQYARGESTTTDTLPFLMPEPAIPTDIPDFGFAEKRLAERGVLGLDIEQHLMTYERERVASKGGITTSQARTLQNGEKAILVGNPIRLRFPPTPTGRRVVFFDLEDETGLMNVTCFDDVYQKYGHAIVLTPFVTVKGHIQIRNDYPAFLASAVLPYHPKLYIEANPQTAKLKTADFLVG